MFEPRPISRRDFLKLSGAGFVGVSALGVVGCGTTSSQGPQGNELNLYVSADVPSLDPAQSESTLDNNINMNILEGLYRFDRDSKPIPGQAEGAEVSGDGTTYTFTLREGLKWSNGEPVTAQDFKYAWLRALAPETAAPQATDISIFVEGADAYNRGEGKASDVAIEVPDDRTLVVGLTTPAPFFLQLVGNSALYLPLNQKFVEEQGDDFSQRPENILYNGAYTLTEFNPTNEIVFQKNPDYWDAQTATVETVYVKVIKQHSTALNLYQSGELDQVQLESQDVERFEDTPEYATYKTGASYYMYMNNQDPVISNRNIRKALSLAFDRETLARDILGAGTVPAEGLVPPVTPSGAGDGSFREAQGRVIGFDPDQAKEFWDRGVEELGEVPSLTMLGQDDSTADKISQYMQAQFKQNLGVDVSIERNTFESFLQRAGDGDYQIGTGSGWQGVYNDAQNYLEIFASDHPQNFAQFENAAYDELIESIKGETNREERLRLMMRAERLLLDEEAVIAPQYSAGIGVATKPRVESWAMNMAVDVGNYKYWRLG